MPLKNDCFALPPGVDWTPVGAALARLKDGLTPVTGVEEAGLEAASGRILARDVFARTASPPHDNAAVDGYALASASLTPEGEQRLRLLEGRAAAGAPFGGVVLPGTALRILTGAPMPEGADSVLMQEDAEVADGALRFGSGLGPGANRRRAGEDLAAGALALAEGRRLTPADIAQAAAVGLARLPVRKRLRVALLSTGDELREAEATLAPGQIHDANRPMLRALCAALGFDALDLGRIADEAGAVRAALGRAAESADAILSSGGASGGDEDHVARELRAMGALSLWRIAMKPGRPLALGQIGAVPVFGLPGNPVAAFVCFLLFARPALLRLAGADWEEPPRYPLIARQDMKKKPGRSEYLRGKPDGAGGVAAFRSQGSGLISGLRWSEGLIALDHDRDRVKAGETVDFIPYSALF